MLFTELEAYQSEGHDAFKLTAEVWSPCARCSGHSRSLCKSIGFHASTSAPSAKNDDAIADGIGLLPLHRTRLPLVPRAHTVPLHQSSLHAGSLIDQASPSGDEGLLPVPRSQSPRESEPGHRDGEDEFLFETVDDLLFDMEL